jgi:hypothetical protein
LEAKRLAGIAMMKNMVKENEMAEEARKEVCQCITILLVQIVLLNISVCFHKPFFTNLYNQFA